MNITLPEVFDLSSLSRALDEDIAAQEHAGIDYVPMDADDEWVPAPVLHMDAPRPWHNPEPQPAWNNLELELENDPVENASQDVPGWYVNLREQNDQPRPTWHNRLPVVSVRRIKNARASAGTPPVLAPRAWHNPGPQPAWNNLELELENPSVENAPQVQNQDLSGWYVNLQNSNDRNVENSCVREAPTPTPVLSATRPWHPAPPAPTPRPWHNHELQPAWNNLELKLENPPVENAPQVPNDVPDNLRESNYQPRPIGRNFLPVISVRRVKNPRVREPPAPTPSASVVWARKEEKARLRNVLVSAMKRRTPVAPTSARKAGKARVPGIKISTRKAENARAPSSLASMRKAEKIFVLDAPTSARKLEKARAPCIPALSPHVPAPPKSTAAHPRLMVPLRIDLSNMSSSSKVKLEDMSKVDDQMRFSWLAYTNQIVPPKVTNSHHQRNLPITRAHQSPAKEDIVMFNNDYIDPTVSISTPENEDTTSDDAHPTHSTNPVQPVVEHVKEGEPTVEHNVEDDVAASADKEENSSSAGNPDETGEEDDEESEEETEEERKARVAQLMTEVFGDGEDSDDEEPALAKHTVVSLDHPSISATSDSLTVGATESTTDRSLDTPDDVGTEGNGSVKVADRDEEDEERQAYYRAQLLTYILDDEVEGGQSVQEASLVPVPVLATRDPRKRKREDDGPSTAPCLVTIDPRKRKRYDDGPSTTPCLVTMDPRKRKRDDDVPPAPSLFIRDPRKRRREADALPIPPLATKDCRKRKREDEMPAAPSLVTRDPRKRLKG